MTFLSQATSKFDRPFVITALLPTAIFLPLSTAVVAQSFWGIPHLLNEYSILATAWQIALPLAAVAAIWFVALMMNGRWLFIVQFFEGYYLIQLWAWILRPVRQPWPVPGTTAHFRRRHKLEARSKQLPHYDWELDLNYDSVNPEVLPTSLGNILNAAEKYSENRYGIDSVVFWTRLAMLMPEQVLKEVEALIIEYQLPLIVAAWAALLTISSLGPLLGGDVHLFVIAFGSGVVTCYAGYFVSLRAARNYGLALRSAFDVYRHLLTEHWPSLETIDEERTRFSSLREFVVNGRVIDAPTPPVPRTPKPRNLVANARSFRSPKLSRLWRPGLPLWFFVAGLSSMALGVVYINLCNRAQYLITTGNVEPYSMLTHSIEQKELPRRRFTGRPIPVAFLEHALIATAPLPRHTVLTEANAVELNLRNTGHVPMSLIQVPVAPARTSQFGLVPGTTVTVAFSGKADFKSDPTCRNAWPDGASRTVPGEIISIKNVGPADGNLIVALGAQGAAAIACYGTSPATILKMTGDVSDNKHSIGK